MKLSAILEPMIAAGVPGDVILATVKAFEEQRAKEAARVEEADEERRAKVRARVQKWRDKQKETPCNVTERFETQRNGSRGGDARGLDNLQPKKISGEDKKEETRAAAPRGDLADFRSELSSILDPDRIEALVAVRRKKGATMTANTGRLLVAAIQRCHLPPAEVADEMALRNWTSVKPDWLESKSSPARNSTAPPRKPNAFDALAEISRMKGWTDEPASLPGNHQDAQRLPAGDCGHSGVVVDLRRGADWSR